jgi:hypothetical protein
MHGPRHAQVEPNDLQWAIKQASSSLQLARGTSVDPPPPEPASLRDNLQDSIDRTLSSLRNAPATSAIRALPSATGGPPPPSPSPAAAAIRATISAASEEVPWGAGDEPQVMAPDSASGRPQRWVRQRHLIPLPS